MKKDNDYKMPLIFNSCDSDITRIGKSEDKKCDKYVKMALDYANKYSKNSSEISYYLMRKGIKGSFLKEIMEIVEQKRYITDEELAKLLASEYARKGYGPLAIKQKMERRCYSKIEIEWAIATLDAETIQEGKDKLLAKTVRKYADLPQEQLEIKIKEQFYKAGYQNFDQYLE